MHLKSLKPNRHLNNILANNSELKKLVDWPKILIAIIVIFESLQYNIKYLFLPIRKIAATIYISSS